MATGRDPAALSEDLVYTFRSRAAGELPHRPGPPTMNRSRLPAAIGAFALLVTPALGQISGLAFTTNPQGGSQELFASTADVHLAGGPRPGANCAAPGLPDGSYFFQVTDVSGELLLSSDDILQRVVTVQGGVITGATAGGHTTLPGPCSSQVVALAPFAALPALDGECRVWMTRVDRYAPGQGVHGFVPEFSKADTFKVATAGPLPPQTKFHGTAAYDVNGNGVYDVVGAGEVPNPGWKIALVTDGASAQTFTDADGNFQFFRALDQTAYCLDSIPPAPGYVGSPGGRWVATSPRSVKAPASDPDIKINFAALFLINTPELARSKGYWHNQGEAELQACDPLWRETINALCLRTNFSNPRGQDGTLFTVSETAPFSEAFAALSDYLTAPANGVIANILSVQYCAANLNASCGPFDGETVYIDRFGDGVLLSFEDLAALTLGLLCDPRSADTGPHGDQEWREVLMGCLNEWDTMNSNGSSIFTGSTNRPAFASPY